MKWDCTSYAFSLFLYVVLKLRKAIAEKCKKKRNEKEKIWVRLGGSEGYEGDKVSNWGSNQHITPYNSLGPLTN